MAGNLKTDESFLEKISIGAIGTKEVYENLLKSHHRPIELERGSMSYKIWKSIKIKRIRVPDILCVDCGKRFESRAKTKLEITMSHSNNDKDRAWDYGLNNDDYVALVACKRNGDSPIDWKASSLIQYIKVSELKDTFGKNIVKQETRKGVQEGFESRITWPSAKASADGKISYISSLDDEKKKIQFKRNLDNRTITLSLVKQRVTIELFPIVKVGDLIEENEIIASVVQVYHTVECQKDKDAEYYKNKLNSISLSERYAAAKALSYFNIDKDIYNILKKKLSQEEEHIYIKLECAASLSRQEHHAGFDFIKHCINSEHLVDRLEAVIISSEINNENSFTILTECLKDTTQHHEIRAGAAWALGELGRKESINVLKNSFNALETNIKVEAARALSKISRNNVSDVIKLLSLGNPEEKQGIAWAISKNEFRINDLLPFLTDRETRTWISYIIGMQNKENYLTEIENLKKKDSEVYFAVTVLWRIMESWINGLEEY